MSVFIYGHIDTLTIISHQFLQQHHLCVHCSFGSGQYGGRGGWRLRHICGRGKISRKNQQMDV